jgi:hypothetical protein
MPPMAGRPTSSPVAISSTAPVARSMRDSRPAPASTTSRPPSPSNARPSGFASSDATGTAGNASAPSNATCQTIPVAQSDTHRRSPSVASPTGRNTCCSSIGRIGVAVLAHTTPPAIRSTTARSAPRRSAS